MSFDFESLAELREIIVGLGKALFPDLNFSSDRSFYGNQATFMAGAATQVLFAASTVREDLHPLTSSEGKPINDWGFAFGVERGGATASRKLQAGRVRGAAGATVAAGTQLQDVNTGLVFHIANATPVVIPGVAGVDPDSFFDADIESVDLGSQTRLGVGAVLSFLSPPVGIETDVVLQLALDEGGFDAEQFGSYRTEVLSTMSTATSGGNQSDFQRWAKQSLDAIQSAYAYPNRAGRGTMDLVAFYAGSGAARVLTLQDRTTMLDYVRSQAPFQVTGVGGGLRALVAVPDPQRVEILVTTDGRLAYDFDWSGSAIVFSYTPATRQLKFTTPLPSQLVPGKRLILVGTVGGSGVTAQDGRQYLVESVVAADTVVLTASPPIAPATGDLIYPGGPLVDPIRDAIVGHLNGEIVYAGRGKLPVPASSAAPIDQNGQSVVGLDILANGIGPSNPVVNGKPKYGRWNGGISIGTLFTIATYKAGVRGISVLSPATDYQAQDDVFPNDGQIHFVVPGVTIVRSA